MDSPIRRLAIVTTLCQRAHTIGRTVSALVLAAALASFSCRQDGQPAARELFAATGEAQADRESGDRAPLIDARELIYGTELLSWRGPQGIVTASLSGPLTEVVSNTSKRLVTMSLYLYGHPEGVLQGANLFDWQSSESVELIYDDGLRVSMKPMLGQSWGTVTGRNQVLLEGGELIFGG